MSINRCYQSQGDTLHEYQWAQFPRNYSNNYYYPQHDYFKYNAETYSGGARRVDNNTNDYDFRHNIVPRNCREPLYLQNYSKHQTSPSIKRRKVSENAWESDAYYHQPIVHYNAPCTGPSNDFTYVSAAPAPSSTSTQCGVTGKRDRSDMEGDNDSGLISREEMERCSPSRKDGIDALHEARLRYSYCAFIQDLGLRLDLPQTTLGTAMVLCHRFFVRRSHACHDRFLIATAALFLAAKSEETPRPLNDVLKASCEILHKQSFTVLSYTFPVDFFEQYRERIIEAEHLILTTLNFEFSVEHPFDSLTSILNKLGFSQRLLVDLALNLVSEGVSTRLDDRLMIYLAAGLICCHDVLHLKLNCRCVVDCLTLIYLSSRSLAIAARYILHPPYWFTSLLSISASLTKFDNRIPKRVLEIFEILFCNLVLINFYL